MSRTEKIVIGLAVLNFIYFFIMAFTIYEMKFKNEDLKEEIKFLKETVTLNEKTNNILLIKVNKELVEIQDKLKNKTKQISIIEESLDPANTRWAKIKVVRQVIKDTSKINLNIKDYTTMASAVVDYSEEYDVSVPLVLAVMRRESAYNPRATSHVGALGLMQLMPATASDIAPEIGERKYNLFNIKDNIKFGTWYLRKMLDRFKDDIGLAVRAYNCGPHFVEKVLAGDYEDYPSETRKYVEIVLEWKKEFESLEF